MYLLMILDELLMELCLWTLVLDPDLKKNKSSTEVNRLKAQLSSLFASLQAALE